MARLRGVLACFLALAVWGGVSLHAQAGFPPFGFAIWPEDNEGAATAACDNRDDDQAWRTNREETAKQFVREELDWPSPVLYTDPATGSPSRLVIGDEEPGGVFLGIVLELFLYGDCWYVTHVFPREDSIDTTAGFTEVDGETHLLLRQGGGWVGMWADVGFGDESDFPVQDGEQKLIPVEDETTTGHYFLYAEDQPSMAVQGHSLPAPMDPSTAEPVSPRGGYAMWPFHEVGRYSGVRRCSRDWMHEPERVVKAFIRQEVGEISELQRQDRAHWIAEVDNVRFRVVLRHVRKDCWPVRRVVSLDRPIDTTIRPAEDGYTIDFEWGDASAASIRLDYGGLWDGAYIERLPGPFSEPESYDFSRQGRYLVTLLDEDGNVVGIEGSQLGPVTD